MTKTTRRSRKNGHEKNKKGRGSEIRKEKQENNIKSRNGENQKDGNSTNSKKSENIVRGEREG